LEQALVGVHQNCLALDSNKLQVWNTCRLGRSTRLGWLICCWFSADSPQSLSTVSEMKWRSFFRGGYLAQNGYGFGMIPGHGLPDGQFSSCVD